MATIAGLTNVGHWAHCLSTSELPMPRTIPIKPAGGGHDDGLDEELQA